MRPSAAGLLICFVLLSAQTRAQQAPPGRTSDPLPVKRVVLYKAGIGYFEHVGEITGSDEVTISFTSNQLDDALKSLTAVDLGSGRVTGIRFNSVAPISERLRALRLPLGEATSLHELLVSLRGARVSVRNAAGAATGRLVSLDRMTRVRDNRPEEYTLLVLATDAGELRSSELTPSVVVTLGETDLRRELEEYLRIVGSARERDVRRMTVASEGTGRRQLLVSYISEVPVWKVNYRLVLDSGRNRKPLLQGWAIVDNTVGEDWNGVELSLVAGAPQSFVQRVSQPVYTRRPVVPLPTSALLTPQTHQGALREGGAGVRGHVTDPSGAALPGATVRLLNDRGEEVFRSVTGADGGYVFSPLAEGTYRLHVSLAGFAGRSLLAGVSRGAETVHDVQLWPGAVTESVAVTGGGSAAAAPARPRQRAQPRGLEERVGGVGGGTGGGVVGGVVGGLPETAPPPSPDAVADARAGIEAAAAAQQLGDAFEYRIKEPITVRRNESALVPIARADVEAEKVTLWSPRGGRAVRAVWMTNSSPLTLDAGTFSVVEDGAFAGEGLLETIKPGERRLLSYAADAAVTVEAKQDPQPARIFRVRSQHGVLLVQRETRERWSYTVRNENPDPRVVVLEHPARAGWRTTASVPATESAAGVSRLKIEVEPHKSAVVTATDVRPEETQYTVGHVTDDFLRVLVRGGLAAEDVERALKPVLAKRAEIEQLGHEIEQRRNGIRAIEQDQARLRENIRALGSTRSSRGLIDRYMRQMSAHEDRLEVLRREIAQLEQKMLALEAEAMRLLDGVSLDATS